MECLIYKTVVSTGIRDTAVRQTVDIVLRAIKKQQATVSVHFIGDRRIRRLNRVYRHKDYVTDVLSFPDTEGVAFPGMSGSGGDIFISVPQIRRQAHKYGVSYKEELVRMMVHGILHLFGYDHMNDRDAAVMFRLQDKLVDQCLDII